MNNSFHREQEIKQELAKKKAESSRHMTMETVQLEKDRAADGDIASSKDFDVAPAKPSLWSRIMKLFGGKG